MNDLDLVRKPDPMIIESLFRITDRDRTPWDAETLLIMAIARESMAHKATDKDCEQPYSEFATEEELQDLNESVVGSFFSRFKSK